MFSSMMSWICGGAFLLVVVVGGLFVALRLLNRRSSNDVFHLGRTKAGKIGAFAKNIDPAEQMIQAAEDAEGELAQAYQALTACDALKSSLERQVAAGERMVKTLEVNLTKKLASASDTDPEVQSLAKRLRTARTELETNTAQLNAQRDLYESTSKSIKTVAARVEGYKQEAKRLDVQLKLSEQTAKIQSAVASINLGGANEAFNRIDQYREVAMSQIDQNNAKVRVATEHQAMTNPTVEETDDVSDILDELRKKSQQ